MVGYYSLTFLFDIGIFDLYVHSKTLISHLMIFC